MRKYIYADELRLTRVFENLVLNALTYTPKDGSIIIKQLKNDTSHKLSFYNSGQDIPLKNQKTFFQEDLLHVGMMIPMNIQE